MEEQGRSLHIRGVLSDYFTLESHLASTRSADAYNAVHKGRETAVCLWMLRHPLSLNSEAVKRFLSRLRSIQELKSHLCQVLEFGVDSSGMAFAVVPALDGSPVNCPSRDLTEVERRFMSCLRLVERLHTAGIVCGDLSTASFWVHRSGDIWFTGVMGSFDTEAAATAVMPPVGTLHFVAPEQRAGGGVEQASDVFALGVLGYCLLTGHFPYGDNNSVFLPQLDLNNVPPLTTWIPNPPIWAEEVLRRCLEPSPEKRYASAGAIIQGVSESRQRALSQSELPVKSRRDLILKKPTGLTGEKSLVDVPAVDEEENKNLLVGEFLRPGIIIAAGIIFCAALFLSWRIMSSRRVVEPTVAVDTVGDRGSEGVKRVVESLSKPQVLMNEKAAKLKELVDSGDPLAHDILVKSAQESTAPELRGLSEQALIDRVRRQGYARAAEQAKQWLRTIPSGEVPPSYEPLLRSLNNSLPPQARDAALREAYATNPKTALRFAAALALDSAKIDDYQTVMSQLVGDSLGLQDSSSHSVLGLILAHPELALIFGEDVVQRRAEIPDRDLEWILKILADRNDLNVRAFADLAIEKGVLSPLRRMYLTMVSERGDLPGDVLNSLVRAAAGALTIKDIAPFGRWYDSASEKVLLAICADAPDNAVALEAFEVVAGKSLSIQPSGYLIEWVRKNYWDKRSEFAKPIGMLANLDLVPFEKVKDSLSVLDPYVKDSRLINLMLQANNPQVTRLVIDKYSGMLGPGTLLNLLKNSDPNVRMLAIRSLKPYNEISTLKVVIDSYDKEKDEEVRKVYRETFWMLEKRG